MMLNILQFVMQHYLRASMAALALGILTLAPLLQLPFMVLTLALVALACLRWGRDQGMLVCLWGASPILAFTFLGPWQEEYLHLQKLNLPPFLWVAACALLLRYTRSWVWVLAANTLCALLCTLLLQWFAADFLNTMVAEWQKTMEQLVQGNENALQGLQVPTARRYAVIYSNGIALLALLCLILGRYWQAMLYNPGGLRRELHRLRLPLPLALALVALWLSLLLLARQGGAEYAWKGYESILALPLLVAGLALVHALAARWDTVFGLVLFYAALFLIPPLRTLLVLAAAADSQWDFRARFATDSDASGHGGSGGMLDGQAGKHPESEQEED